MEKNTVKRRIFRLNAGMVCVTLLILAAVNVLAVKIYGEMIEQEFRTAIERIADEGEWKSLIEQFTIYRNGFFILLIIDGLLCAAVLAAVSGIFTRKMTEYIMVPVNALTEGAQRIRNNELTKDIEYHGDTEFEQVCDTFNDMRKSLLAEKERNERYEKARTDMIAGISHDLRTPLTAVKGSIKGLLDGVVSKPEQQQRFLQTAYKRTEDMEQLLSRLFYLSRLETGNVPVQLLPIELSGFIGQYAGEKQALYGSENFEITAETNGITAEIAADSGQLLRILDNLLENSRKYAECSPLKIKISLNRAGEKIQLLFSDNGAGVPEEKLPYLFDEFYRADESRNKKDGSGLGLYIVKCLTEAMNGSVTAENADGFCVSLLFSEM